MKFSALKNAVLQGDGFVVFRLPKTSALQIASGVWSKTQSLNQSQTGFVIADANQSVFYSLQNATSEISIETLADCLSPEIQVLMKLPSAFPVNTSELEYLKAIERTKQLLTANDCKKAVISRCHFIDGPFVHHTSFKQLLEANPNAFCYYTYIPSVGCWMGATPEVLVKGNESTGYETYSLAGTKQKSEPWSAKELEEQQLVTQFIETIISNYLTKEVRANPAETVDVGSFHHLKSIIPFSCKHQQLFPLIQKLHPTPAVCGSPKQEALNIIAQIEDYSRTFYTGFLGVIKPELTSLFVNLRCAQWFENGCLIYVGGGITVQSNAISEWNETVIKASVIGQCLVKV